MLREDKETRNARSAGAMSAKRLDTLKIPVGKSLNYERAFREGYELAARSVNKCPFYYKAKVDRTSWRHAYSLLIRGEFPTEEAYFEYKLQRVITTRKAGRFTNLTDKDIADYIKGFREPPKRGSPLDGKFRAIVLNSRKRVAESVIQNPVIKRARTIKTSEVIATLQRTTEQSEISYAQPVSLPPVRSIFLMPSALEIPQSSMLSIDDLVYLVALRNMGQAQLPPATVLPPIISGYPPAQTPIYAGTHTPTLFGQYNSAVAPEASPTTLLPGIRWIFQ